jgi:hypothetical protein
MHAPPARKGFPKFVIAAAAVGLLAAAFVGYKLLNRPHRLNLQNMQIEKLTQSGKAAMVAISPDGRYVVYVLRDGEQQSLWMRHVATKSDVQVLAPDIVALQGRGVFSRRKFHLLHSLRQDHGKLQLPVSDASAGRDPKAVDPGH